MVGQVNNNRSFNNHIFTHIQLKSNTSDAEISGCANSRIQNTYTGLGKIKITQASCENPRTSNRIIYY